MSQPRLPSKLSSWVHTSSPSLGYCQTMIIGSTGQITNVQYLSESWYLWPLVPQKLELSSPLKNIEAILSHMNPNPWEKSVINLKTVNSEATLLASSNKDLHHIQSKHHCYHGKSNAGIHITSNEIGDKFLKMIYNVKTYSVVSCISCLALERSACLGYSSGYILVTWLSKSASISTDLVSWSTWLSNWP